MECHISGMSRVKHSQVLEKTHMEGMMMIKMLEKEIKMKESITSGMSYPGMSQLIHTSQVLDKFLLEIEIMNMNMVGMKMNKMTEIQMKKSTSGMSHIRECLESYTAATAGEIRNNSHSHSSAVSYQSYHVTFTVSLIISNTF